METQLYSRVDKSSSEQRSASVPPHFTWLQSALQNCVCDVCISSSSQRDLVSLVITHFIEGEVKQAQGGDKLSNSFSLLRCHRSSSVCRAWDIKTTVWAVTRHSGPTLIITLISKADVFELSDLSVPVTDLTGTISQGRQAALIRLPDMNSILRRVVRKADRRPHACASLPLVSSTSRI